MVMEMSVWRLSDHFGVARGIASCCVLLLFGLRMIQAVVCFRVWVLREV